MSQQFGTFYGVTEKGAPIMVDAYFSDVDKENVKFDSGVGATSTSQDFVTFSSRVILTDLAVVTGMTAVSKIRLTIGGNSVPSALLRVATHLTTIATRPKLNIKLEKNARFGCIQMA